MPKRIQPEMLKWFCAKTVGMNLINACLYFESVNKQYDECECLQFAYSIQKGYLQDLLDDLYPYIYLNRPVGLDYKLMDHRILINVFIHENTTSLNCNTTTRAITNQNFWFTKIVSLKNLTSLDLRLMCTDTYLHLVGRFCPNLEIINCVSKHEHEFGDRNFNALRIRSFVSDQGLFYLSNCKKLRIILMNKQIHSQRGGYKLSIEGIRRLLLSLPKLEILNFDDLGKVISDGMTGCYKLYLKEVKDSHPTLKNIHEVIRLCSCLKSLLLIRPYNTTTDDIFSPLTHSNLQIQNFHFTRFEFDSSFKSLLLFKGEYLYELTFSKSLITLSDIIVIGLSCPNLKLLDLNQITRDMNEKVSDFSDKQLFSNLESLSLGGDDWDLRTVLPICIRSTRKLTTLTIWLHLLHRNVEDICFTYDDFFNELIRGYYFRQLTSLSLCDSCILQVSTIKTLVYNCPLKFLSLTSRKHDESGISQLGAELNENNYCVVIYSHYL